MGMHILFLVPSSHSFPGGIKETIEAEIKKMILLNYSVSVLMLGLMSESKDMSFYSHRLNLL